MSKLLWWPQPNNQGLNYIRLKYVFESQQEMINSTTPSLQEVLGSNYELIMALYGNLFVIADNKLKAQAMWKMGTMKFSGQYKMKAAFNNLALDTLLETTTTTNTKNSATSQNGGQNDHYLYNDQSETTEGTKYHSEGAKNSSNGSVDQQGVGNQSVKEYNLDKVKAIIELASTAESDLISSMINWIAAAVQPNKMEWGTPIEIEEN